VDPPRPKEISLSYPSPLPFAKEFCNVFRHDLQRFDEREVETLPGNGIPDRPNGHNSHLRISRSESFANASHRVLRNGVQIPCIR
jgi:hypothetical protein